MQCSVSVQVFATRDSAALLIRATKQRFASLRRLRAMVKARHTARHVWRINEVAAVLGRRHGHVPWSPHCAKVGRRGERLCIEPTANSPLRARPERTSRSHKGERDVFHRAVLQIAVLYGSTDPFDSRLLRSTTSNPTPRGRGARMLALKKNKLVREEGTRAQL